ncbi:MAG: hypothetical protein HYT20_01480 [Candidatus Nealsonbacteria bacterium]|nr:hypothetical protein [Candidatus Nealsonbacteria bacterium]
MSITKEEQIVLENIRRSGRVPDALRILQKSLTRYFQRDLEYQLRAIIAAKIPETIGMTEPQFRDMAKELLKPEKGQDNYLVVVGPKLLNPYQFMKHLVWQGKTGQNYLHLPNLTDAKDIIPNPYLYLIYDAEDGTQMLKVSPDNCIIEFQKQDRRGQTWFEGCSSVLQSGTQALDTDKGGHYMDLPGSRYGSGLVPCLSLWNGEPRLGASPSGGAGPRYGSASCRS